MKSEIRGRVLRLFALSVLLLSFVAFKSHAQNVVTANQGAPGKQGPWFVVILDGGSSGGGGSSTITSPVSTGVPDGGETGVVVRVVNKSAVPTTTAVTCATTATAMPTTVLTNRTSACFFNNSAVTVFIGGSAVTTSNGFPLATNTAFCDTVAGKAYSCIVTTGTAEVRVLEN